MSIFNYIKTLRFLQANIFNKKYTNLKVKRKVLPVQCLVNWNPCINCVANCLQCSKSCEH